MSGAILVFGANGQLGREISSKARTRGVVVVGATRTDADISDAQDVARTVAAAKPHLIVNCAAYTAVDRAESEPELAKLANVIGARVVAHTAEAYGIPLVHLSTDYVFDGGKNGAYVETDPVAPQGVYGRTKAEGEEAVRKAAYQHIILRTSWVYGPYGNNFLKTILRLASERPELRIVADQRGCPTSTADLAEAIFAIYRTLLTFKPIVWGTYHFAGTGVTTWYDFAKCIVAEQAIRTELRPTVIAIPTSDYPTPARRPANSELDSGHFTATFRYSAAPWQQRVKETVETLFQPVESNA
jgi:dTDP-4-dehydrorhamnose reductase